MSSQRKSGAADTELNGAGNGKNTIKSAASAQWAALKRGSFLDDDVLDISSESEIDSSESDEASNASGDRDEEAGKNQKSASSRVVMPPPATLRPPLQQQCPSTPINSQERMKSPSVWSTKPVAKVTNGTRNGPAAPESKQIPLVLPLKITIRKDSLTNGDVRALPSVSSFGNGGGRLSTSPVKAMATPSPTSSPKLAFFPRRSDSRQQQANEKAPGSRHFPKTITASNFAGGEAGIAGAPLPLSNPINDAHKQQEKRRNIFAVQAAEASRPPEQAAFASEHADDVIDIMHASFHGSDSAQLVHSPLHDPPGAAAAAEVAAPLTMLERKFGKHAMVNLFRAFRQELKGDFVENMPDEESREAAERSSTPPISRPEAKEFETAAAANGRPSANMHALSLKDDPILLASAANDDDDGVEQQKLNVDDKVKIDLLVPYQPRRKFYHRPQVSVLHDFINATRKSRPLEKGVEDNLKQIKCRMMNLSRFPKPNKHLLKPVPSPTRINRDAMPRRRQFSAEYSISSSPSSIASSFFDGAEEIPVEVDLNAVFGRNQNNLDATTLSAASEASVAMIKPKNKGGRPKGWKKNPDAHAATSAKRKRSPSGAAADEAGPSSKSKKKKTSLARNQYGLEDADELLDDTRFPCAYDFVDNVSSSPQLLLTKGAGAGTGKKSSKKKKSSRNSSKHATESAVKTPVTTPKKKTIKISSKGRPTMSSGIMHEPFGNVLPSPANFVPAFMPAVVSSGGHKSKKSKTSATAVPLDDGRSTSAKGDVSSSTAKKKKSKKKSKKSSPQRAEAEAINEHPASEAGFSSQTPEWRTVPPLILDASRLNMHSTPPYTSSPQRASSATGGAAPQVASSKSKKKNINLSSFVNKHIRESRRSQFWLDILKRAEGSRFKAELERRRLREMALKKLNCRIDRMQQSEPTARRSARPPPPQSSSDADTALNEALMLAHKDYIRIVTKEVPKRAKEFIDLRRKRLVNARRVVDGCKKQWEFKRFGGADGEQPSNANMLNVRGPTFQELKWRSIIARKKAGTLFRKRVKTLRHSRKQREKEEADRVKREMETKETLRQQRKLNFLLTQTELYAHFVSRKCNTGAAETVDADENSSVDAQAVTGAAPAKAVPTERDILRKLDQPGSGCNVSTSALLSLDDQLETDTIDFGGDAKQVALRNVREAFERTRQRALDHDRATLAAAAASASAPMVVAEAAANTVNATQLKQNFYGQEDDDAAERERKANLVEVEQPALLVGQLKHYQLKGIGWLLSLYENGINGILADEMGLGKTIQTIAFLGLIAERFGIWGPFLVIAPASTLHNWYQELSKFLPKFKTLPYWGTANERKTMRKFWQKKDIHTEDAAFHVVITSYQLAVLDASIIKRVNWQFLVLDEAQAIKSSASMRWNALLSFPCRNRLLLTGTPVQNTMAELWALLHFIMPTLFDSHAEFDEWFSRDIEGSVENKRAMEEKNLNRLHMILKPFMLRRTKKEVEHELGAKIEKLVPCPLSMRQQRLYRALKNRISLQELMQQADAASRIGMRKSNVADADADDAPTGGLMNLVMQFRKVCNHPDLFERRDVSSPIFAPVLEMPLSRLLYNTVMEAANVNAGARRNIPADLNVWLSSGDNYTTRTSRQSCSSSWTTDTTPILPYMRLMGLTTGDLARSVYDRTYAALGLSGGGRFFTFWSWHIAQLERLRLEKLAATFHRPPFKSRKSRSLLPISSSAWHSMPLVIHEIVNPFSFASLCSFDTAQRVVAADGSSGGQSVYEQLIFTHGNSTSGSGGHLVAGLVDLIIHNLSKEPIEHRKMREKRQWLVDKLKDRLQDSVNATTVSNKSKTFANGLIEVMEDEGSSEKVDQYTADLYITPSDIEREAFGYMGRNKRRHGPGANRGAGRYAMKDAVDSDPAPSDSNLKSLQSASNVSLLDDSMAGSIADAEEDAEIEAVPVIRTGAKSLVSDNGEAEKSSRVIRCLPLPLPRWVAFRTPAIEAAAVRMYCDDARYFAQDGRRLAVERHLLCHGPKALQEVDKMSVDIEGRPVIGLSPNTPEHGLNGVPFIDTFSNIRLPERHHLITDSGKLRTLDRLLKQLKMEGHRVLLYSQMTRMIDLLEEFFRHKRYRYLRLDGSCSIASRRDMVAKYQSQEDVFIFLLSTRAGGLGINLTAADTVIFYDSDWNPTVDQQAMDRAHRLGQTKQVTVYRLVCKGTIEERILFRAQQKSEIQQMVIEGGDFRLDSAQIKPNEIMSLLLDETGAGDGGGDEPEFSTHVVSNKKTSKTAAGASNSLTAGRDPRGRFTLAASLRR